MVICNICKEIVTNPICPMCMAKSIKAWLVQNNPKLAKQISANNIKKSRQYDWDKISDKYMAEYNSLLNKPDKNKPFRKRFPQSNQKQT